LQALTLLAVAAVAAGAPHADSDSQTRAAVGQWRLTEAVGKVACTLTLTGAATAGGWEVKAPLPCRGAFPPLREVAAWTFNAQNALVLSDTQARPIVAFPQPVAGAYEAKAPDGKTWRLEPSGLHRLLTPRERMSGDFRLSGGAWQCDISLRADIFGKAGWIAVGQCPAPTSAKGLSIWTFTNGRLVLMDKARKPLLALKAGDPGAFVSADPKAEPVTLTRR
jgi:hypothetical protein